ncbi:MAG TPA: hypothetical protein VE093_20110 [Polyangiaceae bacterium]|nr:hypothetical protein [Polyangiaceae bacterium]
MLLRWISIVSLGTLLTACGGNVVLLGCEEGASGSCASDPGDPDPMDPEPQCGPGLVEVGGACFPHDPSLDPCLIDENVVSFDGDEDDFIHPGKDIITKASWSGWAGSNSVIIYLTPSDLSQGDDWFLEFSSEQLSEPLQMKAYEDAERASFASPGHPGLDVSGDHRGCNILSGRFVIYEISSDGSDLVTNFTASFEQHCEAGPPALRGCVHFKP